MKDSHHYTNISILCESKTSDYGLKRVKLSNTILTQFDKSWL